MMATERRVPSLVVGGDGDGDGDDDGDLLECGADVVVQQYNATSFEPTPLSLAIARKWPYAAPTLASPAQSDRQGAAKVGDVYLALPPDTTLGEMKRRVQKRHEQTEALVNDATEWQPIVARIVVHESDDAATGDRCAAFGRALRILRAQLVRIGARTVAFPRRIGDSATEPDDCWHAYCKLLREFASGAPFRVRIARHAGVVGDAAATSDTDVGGGDDDNGLDGGDGNGIDAGCGGGGEVQVDGGGGDGEVQVVDVAAPADLGFPPRPSSDEARGDASGRGRATKRVGRRENGWLWSDADDEWLCRCCAQLVATVARGSDATRVWRALATVGLFGRDPVGDAAVLRRLNRGIAEVARLAGRPVGPVEARLSLYARGAARHDGGSGGGGGGGGGGGVVGGGGGGVGDSTSVPARPDAPKRTVPGSHLTQLFGAASGEAVAARRAKHDRKSATTRRVTPRLVNPDTAAAAAVAERAPIILARTPAAASPLLVTSGRQPSFAETWLAKYRAPKPRTASATTAFSVLSEGGEGADPRPLLPLPATDLDFVAVGRQLQRRRTIPKQPARCRSAAVTAVAATVDLGATSIAELRPPRPPARAVAAETRASVSPPPPPPPTVIVRDVKRKSVGRATPTDPDADSARKKPRRRPTMPAPTAEADDAGLRHMCESDQDRDEAAATALNAADIESSRRGEARDSKTCAESEVAAVLVGAGPAKSFRKFSRGGAGGGGGGGSASLSSAVRLDEKRESAVQKASRPAETLFAPDCGWIVRKPRAVAKSVAS